MKGNVMSAMTPCYRHPRGVWLVACPDCTAWYLAAALARRDEVVAASPTAATAAHPTRPALTILRSAVLPEAA
jgi:hypothetical protein